MVMIRKAKMIATIDHTSVVDGHGNLVAIHIGQGLDPFERMCDHIMQCGLEGVPQDEDTCIITSRNLRTTSTISHSWS